ADHPRVRGADLRREPPRRRRAVPRHAAGPQRAEGRAGGRTLRDGSVGAVGVSENTSARDHHVAGTDLLPPGTRVLVIDDEPSIRRSLSRVLEERGFAVETAPSGAEGLAAAERWDPRVVLLDLQLPDATGLTILRSLKSRDPTVAVLMITAYGNAGEAV